MSKSYLSQDLNPVAKKHNDLFYKCPGAWLGCMPHSYNSDDPTGHVIIDPAKVVEAVLFLRKHYIILKTDYDKTNRAMFFQIQTKGSTNV